MASARTILDDVAPTDDPSSPGSSVPRRLVRGVLIVATLIVVAAASIAFALQVTPMQSVSAVGQTVEVGVAAPTATASGPGEIVLFGQTLPTHVDFVGPVRPRLVLTNISVNEQLASVFGPGPRSAATRIGDELARGWIRYFVWELVFVTAAAVVLLGALAGWRRYDLRHSLIAIAGGLVFVQVVNLSLIMVTAYTAPRILREVSSLSELVGREPPRVVPPATGPALADVQAVVLGDSTAAGLGGPPIPDGSRTDVACERSTIAFARTLARVNEWNVENLACSGATIRNGVLGRQWAGNRWIRPQLAAAKRAVDPEVVILSVGANDMNWNVVVRVCAASDGCDDRAQTAFFQRNLNRFTSDYYELLRQLGTLPGDPVVVINQYYAPFDPEHVDCLEPQGLTAEKVELLLDRLDALNTVIANGAATFGYRTVQPNFNDHELCTDQSYVQGPDDPAPLHPNARGHLVIALEDERALLAVEDEATAPTDDTEAG